MFDGKLFEEVCTDNKKILPFLFPPPIYYALFGAIRLSIILTHKETTDWFYSNFIQLYYNEIIRPDNTRDHLIHFLSHKDNSSQLFLSEIMLTEDIIPINQDNLISNIQKWLSNGYYINLYVDVSKLPNTRYYKGKSYVHGVILFGYDAESRVFKHMDFNNFETLSIVDIKYDDLKEAFFSEYCLDYLIRNNTSKTYFVKLYKFNENYHFNDENDFPLNVNYIIDQFKDYYYSKNTSYRFQPHIKKEYNIHFGISVHQALIDYLKRIDNSNFKSDKKDIRPFHAVWEHKKTMLNRLKYFEEKNIIKTSEFSDKYSEILKQTETFKMLFFKYTASENLKTIDKMIVILNDIYNLEKEIINNLIIYLENSVKLS